MPPVLQTERIAHLGYGRRLLRCGILFQAMSLVGQTATWRQVRATSALPPIADIRQRVRHVAEVPIVLQKSPSGLCEIEICNYRIGAPVLLNRCCAFQPDLESIFLAEMLKILLQHNLPTPAASRCSNLRHPNYSITSSARARRVGGTSRPSALAVLRLTTNSYLVGACTGKSAALSPFRMRST